MKRVVLTYLYVICISIFLIGCSSDKKGDFDLEKVQSIEVFSVESPNSVLNIIDNKDDINDFVNKLQVQQWSNEDIPSNATKSKIYKMYQEDTMKLGENKTNEKEFKQIATITAYKDSPYINFKTDKLNFNFKIPKDVAEYLSKNEQ